MIRFPALQREDRVERYSWVRKGREGYGYCEDQGSYQLLVRRWRLWGIPLWRKVLDREDIPMDVIIDLGVFGETSWRSKFADYMSQGKGLP